MVLNINELFYVYALKIFDDWFDLELSEGKASLVILPTQMEVRWRKYFLEVEYDSSAEENYSVLPMQVGNISVSFKPLVQEVRKTMLDAVYKAKKILLEQLADSLFWYFFPTEEEHKVTPIRTVVSRTSLLLIRASHWLSLFPWK